MVCVCVCVYVCVCVWVCECVYTCVCVCRYVCTCVCVCVDVYLVVARLLYAAQQLLHSGVYLVMFLEVVFHRGEVCPPLSPLKQILKRERDTHTQFTEILVVDGDNSKRKKVPVVLKWSHL